MGGPAAVIVSADGLRIAEVESSGALKVTASPPQPPPNTAEFVLSQVEAQLVVSTTSDSLSAPIPNGHTLNLQLFAAGSAGDPSEKGSKVEVFWQDGAPGSEVLHVVERVYVMGQTLSIILPDVSKARDGTLMVGDSNGYGKLLVRRTRMNPSPLEVDFVVHGYTEAP